MGSNKLFADLFENTNDLIQSVSPDGRFITVNPAWYKTLKYSKDDLKILHFLDIVHPDDRAHCTTIFNRLNSGERQTGIEVRFISKDERVLFMNGNVFTEMVNGQPKATRGVFRDVTEKKVIEKKLAQSEQKYRELVELASDVIYKTDIYGNITFINDAGMRLTGYDRKEIVGKHFSEFVREDSFESVTRFYKEQISAAIQNTYFEFPFIKKNGETRWFAQNVRVLVDDNNSNRISGSISVCRDVTELREAQGKISKQNAVLNRQNKQIMDALNNLTRSKVSKNALVITLGITLLLFIVSEGILEPLVDVWSGNSAYGFVSKGIIALLFKPIDILVERILMRRAFKRHQIIQG